MCADISLVHGAGLASAATEAAPLPGLARPRLTGGSRFEIYRTGQVHLTSTLFGGGDWHWRLTGRSGKVVADCGGYRNHAECLAAVEGIRAEARSAAVSSRGGERGERP